MKRKGEFTTEQLIKLVFAVIGILVLVYVGYKVANILIQKNEVEQAKESLDKIVWTINSLEEGASKSALVFGPKDWYIFIFKKGQNMPDECDEKNCLCICNGVKRENCFELSVCKGDEIVLKFREKYAASFYLGQSENIFVEKQAGEIFLSKTSFDTALIDELFSKEFLKEFRILVNNCLLLREGESADDFLVDVQKSSLQKKIKASLESFRIGKSREIGYDLSMKVYVKFYSNGKQVSGPSHNFYALEYVKETLATADLDNFEKRVDELLCGDESKLSASYSVYLSKPKS